MENYIHCCTRQLLIQSIGPLVQLPALAAQRARAVRGSQAGLGRAVGSGMQIHRNLGALRGLLPRGRTAGRGPVALGLGRALALASPADGPEDWNVLR